MKRVPELIAQAILDAGIDHIFVYPGGITAPVLNEFHNLKGRVRVILTRNEQTASCMANMYGRLTGKPGIVLCQGPYGISTALFGVNESALGSAPLVLITDITDFGVFHMHGVPQSTSGEYGSLDARGVLKTCCKYVSAPVARNDCIHAIQEALKHAVTGRPGPCAVVIRSENLSDEVDENFLPRVFPSSMFGPVESTTASDSTLKKAVELIRAAQKPVILAGNGINVSKAYAELHALANQLSSPVLTSSMGKGVFDETSTLSFGVVGSFGHPSANRILGEADLVLVAGCRLKPSDTCYENPAVMDPFRQKIIHIDIEPRNMNWIFPAALGIVGDAKTILSQLNAALERESIDKKRFEMWVAEMQRLKKDDWYDGALKMEPTSPIHPKWLVGQISKNRPEETIVTTDGGNNRFWMLRYFQAKPGRYFSPGGTLSVSFGIPAALTAKLLHPEQPVLSVSGDGGFSMQIHALSTAMQYHLGVVFLVMNDSQLGMVREGQGNRPIGSEFIDTDFAAIARAFGCEGKRIEDPEVFGEALDLAFKSNRPYVLDVIVSKEEKIYEQLFSPLARDSFAKITGKKHYYR